MYKTSSSMCLGNNLVVYTAYRISCFLIRS